MEVRRRISDCSWWTNLERANGNMDKVQLTRVEMLEPEHRGLQHYVDASFDRGITGPEVAQGVREKFGLTLPVSTIYSYRMKRWRPRHKSVRERVADLDAIAIEREKRPEKEVRALLIYEKLFDMTPSELHRRDFDMKRVDVENRKLEIEDKRVENQREALRAKLQEAKAAPGRADKAPHPATRAKDEDELRKKIDEIYGIGSAGKDPAPVSEKVGR